MPALNFLSLSLINFQWIQWKCRLITFGGLSPPKSLKEVLIMVE